jgi:hypothetical protein
MVKYESTFELLTGDPVNDRRLSFCCEDNQSHSAMIKAYDAFRAALSDQFHQQCCGKKAIPLQCCEAVEVKVVVTKDGKAFFKDSVCYNDCVGCDDGAAIATMVDAFAAPFCPCCL